MRRFPVPPWSAHELLLTVYALVAGVSLLVAAPEPTSVNAALPGWSIPVWTSGLVAGGVLYLVGKFGPWRRLRRGKEFERAGLLLGAAALVTYSAAAMSVGGGRAFFAAGSCLAWAAANIVRVVQLAREIENGQE